MEHGALVNAMAAAALDWSCTIVFINAYSVRGWFVTREKCNYSNIRDNQGYNL